MRNSKARERFTFPPVADEPTLDQLLAEPIVQQLMHRDHTNEAAIRHLLPAASVQPPSNATNDSHEAYTTFWLLYETTRMWCGRYDREVRARLPGMTRARSAVLLSLAEHEGANQADIAQNLDIRPITLSRLLDRLEVDGFVARLPDPNDRRAHVLRLTGKAWPIIERVNDLAKKVCGATQFGISQAETTQLRALLNRMQAKLSDRSGETPHSKSRRRHDGA